MDMESVSIQLVVEYFLHMFNTLKRQVATINSHRTTLSVVLRPFDGYTVGAHPVISNYINKKCWLERPQPRTRNPDWDISKVFKALMESPFEPPRFDTIEHKKYTTWKTCFLLVFARTSRASELAGFSRDERDLIFTKEGVWLRTIPEFLPKTQTPTIDPEPFSIPKYDTYSGRDSQYRLL